MESSTPFDLSAYLEVEAADLWDDAGEDGAAADFAGEVPGAPAATSPAAFEAACAAAPDPCASIEGLVSALPQYRRLFIDLMLRCEEPCAEEDLCAFIAASQQTSRSVYAPATLCELLERAGALFRAGDDGEPIEDVEPEPVEVEGEDGVYLTCAEPPVWRWRSTEEALAYARADDPAARLAALLAEEPEFAPVYRFILDACALPEGMVMADLNAAVNALPEVVGQRRRAGFFVDKLERCDAIAWDKVWRTTSVGRTAL